MSARSPAQHTGHRTGVLLALALGLLSCGGEPVAPETPLHNDVVHWRSDSTQPLDQGTRGSVVLSRHDSALVGTMGPKISRSRPIAKSAALPALVRKRAKGGRVEYRAPLPGRVHFYADVAADRPAGMRLLHKGRRMPFQAQGSNKAVGKVGTWGYYKGSIVLRLAEGAPVPTDLRVVFPMAAEEERSRHRDLAELAEPRFVHRTVSTFKDRRTGTFVPAPGAVDYRVKLGDHPVLLSSVRLLQPTYRDAGRSDGAAATVAVVQGQSTTELFQVALDPGRSAPVEIDLSAYAGQEITLRLGSRPEGHSALDYVFFEDPVIRDAAAEPRRLVVAFVDTLRRDHLALYGHERVTTPFVDRLAAEGMVFDQAWSVAPWTLPSARSAYTGLLPHHWSPQRHLGHVLAQQGFSTFSVVSNQYLSEHFDLDEGWTGYRGNRGRSAGTQVARAVEYLEAHPNRDVALFVHLIDPHLPYGHHDSTRGRFAKQAWPGLEAAVRNETVTRAVQDHPESKDAIVDYVKRRYDEQIAYVDQQLEVLVKAAGPNTTFVLFSDHGEEFFEDGRIGHGHSLADHQVRVPLVMVGPGIDAGRSETPVSLTDVGATLIALGGGAPQDVDGRSLMPILQGQQLPSEPLALGWNLFESEAWGVLDQGHKWRLRQGIESLERQGERVDGMDLAPWRASFEDVTGMPVKWTWRVATSDTATTWSPAESHFRLWAPDAPQSTWPRLDYYRKRERPTLDGPWLDVRSTKKQRFGSELWVLPGSTETKGMKVSYDDGGAHSEKTVSTSVPPAPGAPIVEAGPVSVQWALAPVREAGPDNAELSDDLRRELEALGYLEDGE